MTQFEEYQGKNQRLGYLVQFLTYFAAMEKTGAGLENQIIFKKIQDRIKQLAEEELRVAEGLKVN